MLLHLKMSLQERKTEFQPKFITMLTCAKIWIRNPDLDPQRLGAEQSSTHALHRFLLRWNRTISKRDIISAIL